jgi:hypothetical protein
MFRCKPYGEDFLTNVGIAVNNGLCHTGIWYDTHVKYGIYGIIKFRFLSLLVYLRLIKPIGMVDVLEYHFDL